MSMTIGGYNPYAAYDSMGTTGYGSKVNGQDDEDLSASEEKALKRSGRIKCETCASRKYQDGSDESDVSFKAPGHIAASSSAATVMAHEQEHVANAYQKAGANDGQVVNCSVTLKTSICPECGRSYVSGGETSTAIKYSNDNYGNSKKSYDAANGAIGNNVDIAV